MSEWGEGDCGPWLNLSEGVTTEPPGPAEQTDTIAFLDGSHGVMRYRHVSEGDDYANPMMMIRFEGGQPLPIEVIHDQLENDGAGGIG